jgi:hypothetical protein
VHIKTVKIKNYKSFFETDPIPFRPGFNLIVGQNDSGKTALLESICPGFEPRPHRSSITAPERNSPNQPHSISTKEFFLSHEDLRDYLSRLQFIGIPQREAHPQKALDYFEAVLGNPPPFFASWNGPNLAGAWFGNENLNSAHTLVFANRAWPSGVLLDIKPATTRANPLSHDMAHAAAQDIYMFKAERYSVGSSIARGNSILAPDASNLPEVLNKLAEDPATERELLTHVSTVFLIYTTSHLRSKTETELT